VTATSFHSHRPQGHERRSTVLEGRHEVDGEKEAGGLEEDRGQKRGSRRSESDPERSVYEHGDLSDEDGEVGENFSEYDGSRTVHREGLVSNRRGGRAKSAKRDANRADATRRTLCFARMALPSKLTVTSVMERRALKSRMKKRVPPRVKIPLVV